MVGQLTLDQHIGVRIPGGQPNFSAIPKDSRSESFCSWYALVRIGAGLFLDQMGNNSGPTGDSRGRISNNVMDAQQAIMDLFKF
jgi:hypothetical protein